MASPEEPRRAHAAAAEAPAHAAPAPAPAEPARKQASSSRARLFTIAGAVAIVLALGLFGWNVLSSSRAGATATAVVEQLRAAIPSEPPMASYTTVPEMDMPVCEVDGELYLGILTIDAINVELPVASTLSDEALAKTPCRYAGSAYDNTLVIAGYNYDEQFGLLGDLREGDAVTLTDMDGNVFGYEVVSLEQLDESSIEETSEGGGDLVLFTGTIDYSKRLIVRCEALA